MRVLSVRQPWAWLLFHGKPIENRDWATAHRGQLLIHASAGMTRRDYEAARFFVEGFDYQLAQQIPPQSEIVRGALIGEVTLVNCVRFDDSDWFQGPVGWLFENPKIWETPVPAKGQLGLWDWNQPPEVLR